MPSTDQTLALLRQAILFVLVLVLLGTSIELVLLKHTDGAWQWTPLVLMGATALVLLWYGVTKQAAALRAFQGVMVLAFVSGGVGVIQHFLANLEYAAESDPSLSGKALYLEAIWGSTPALAPGTMAQLALLGLAFTFRHPRLRRRSAGDDSSSPKDRS
jgi:hypothetical protein